MKLDQMREIAARRTKGPWTANHNETICYDGSTDGFYSSGPSVDWNQESQAKHDAEFIAMASNQFDKLLALAEGVDRYLAEEDKIKRHVYALGLCDLLFELERD